MTATINASTSAGVVVTSDTSGSLALQTNGTTAVTLDTSGNMGIGTSSPNGLIDVASNSNSTVRYYFRNANAGTSAYTILDLGNDTSNSRGELFVTSSGNTSSWGTNSLVLSNSGAFPILFATNNTERMRIDSSGNLLVGTTSQLGNSILSVLSSQANQAVYVRNSNASPGGMFVNYSVATPNNTGNEFFFGNDPAQTRVTLRSNGGIANYSANNVNLSDRREKTNFAPAKSYLDVICAIPVQTFNYIDQNFEEDAGLTLGVVAQDVQAVAPELVSESDWSTEKDGSKVRLSIYQTDLQYALMKCIQEQQALIQQLQADVAALKGTQP